MINKTYWNVWIELYRIKLITTLVLWILTILIELMILFECQG